MKIESRIVQLTQDFYSDYPPSAYPEIMCKNNRPYNCLIVDTHDGYSICLPYRTHIHHSNAFKFKSSARSRQFSSGIDYTKAVVIKDSRYLPKQDAVIDQDEYVETIKNLPAIAENAVAYIDGYIDHIRGIRPLHERTFHRKYGMSTLPYFHKELGLDNHQENHL